jgi:hypothetical protein
MFVLLGVQTLEYFWDPGNKTCSIGAQQKVFSVRTTGSQSIEVVKGAERVSPPHHLGPRSYRVNSIVVEIGLLLMIKQELLYSLSALKWLGERRTTTYVSHAYQYQR